MAAATAPKLYQAWVAVFGSVGTAALGAVVAKQYSVHWAGCYRCADCADIYHGAPRTDCYHSAGCYR